MSKKGEPRNTYKVKKRDLDMISFLADVYPGVKKYEYAKRRFVDGESIVKICLDENIEKEANVRRYTEQVFNELKRFVDASKGYKTLNLTRSADHKKVLEIFLDQYADSGRFLPEPKDWTADILFQMLREREKTIYIVYGQSIFGIKGISVSRTDCRDVINTYVEKYTEKIPQEGNQRVFHLTFERNETAEYDEEFFGLNLRFAEYTAKFRTVGKEYSIPIELPVYMKSYGKASKYRKYKYYPQKYPLTAIDLTDEFSEESIFYRKQWHNLCKTLQKKLRSTTKVGRCTIESLVGESELKNEDGKFLHFQFGEDTIVILDPTVRNAKLIKEYKTVLENIFLK